MTVKFIPNLSTKAGSCLTMANWRDVGVTIIAYDLLNLLVKPGMDVLYQYPNLTAYVGWDQRVVLNAANMMIDSQGRCSVRSSINGEKFIFEWNHLVALISHLSPDYFLLPKGLSKVSLDELLTQLTTKTTVLVNVKDAFEKEQYANLAIYHADTKEEPSAECLSPNLDYLIGSKHAFSAYLESSYSSVRWIESNQPAQDALNGQIQTSSGWIDLTNKNEQMIFSVLDDRCACPTCQQGFTRAYLSHLYTQTPLLCQRLLIQHNVFYACHLPEH